MTGDKLRFRFAKSGDLRLLSHHDLMRCLERMLRRAAVPFKSTAGFHPTPRLVFALSLPLGVVGLDEVVELELTEPHDAEAILARLNAAAPIGLRFHRVSVVPMKATAVPRRMAYRLPLPTGRFEVVRGRADALHSEQKVWVERLKPSPRRLNIRPFLRSIRVDEGAVTFDLWVTPTGTARADELVRLLGLEDVADAGAVLERVKLEIHDETPPGDAADGPPTGPAESRPLEPAALAAAAGRDDTNQPAAASWGASPNGPVVE